MGFRWLSKISTTPRGFGQPTALLSSNSTSRTLTVWLWNERKQVEPSSWARPTFLSLAWAHKLSTLSLDLRAIPTIRPRPEGGAPVEKPSHWGAVWRRWLTAATWAARCATPASSATWWGFVHLQGAYRTRAGSWAGSRSQCPGPWLAM